jgi:hypothetical protein
MLEIVVEEKDEATVEGVQPGLPPGHQLASTFYDVMADTTKHEATFGWRVRSVREVARGA